MKHTLLILGLAIATSVQGQSVKSLTLDDCIAMAINNNQSLQQADRSVLMAMEQREQTKTNSLPTISGNVMGFAATKGLVSLNVMGMEMSMLDNGISASVSVMQPIYTGGQITNGNRLADLGVATSRLQRSLTENEVRLTTEKYYWQIIQLQEKLRTLDQLDKQIEQVRRDAQNAVEAGVRNRNDLLQVKLRQNELRATRIEVENGLKVLKDLLAQHMGLSEELNINEEQSVKSEESKFNSSLPNALYVSPDSALLLTNEYQLLEKQVETEELQYKLAEGKNRPTVAVGGMAYYNNFMDSWQARAVGMVTVSVPISNLLYGTKHDLKKQRMRIENAQSQQRDQGEQLVIRMSKAWNDMNDAYRKVEIAQESIQQSEENLRLNTDYYQYGTATISDLLDAQSLYQQAKDQYVEASTNYQIKQREYLQATGR